MGCQILKVFNNNVVLAKEDEQQVVVISKGVGFGHKTGDELDLNAISKDRRIFHILENGKQENDLHRISKGIEEMERIAHETVALASERLGIEDEDDKLFGALFDHISFSVERLKVGIPIENPFVLEIGVMCRDEYPIAQATAQLVRERLSVDIGEAEIGFIALHLYSAKRQKSVGSAMKNVRVYNQALQILSERYHREFRRTDSGVSSFLSSLAGYIFDAAQGQVSEMPLKNQVRLAMETPYRTAQNVAKMVKQDMGLTLSEDAMAFLAVDIQKLAAHAVPVQAKNS